MARKTRGYHATIYARDGGYVARLRVVRPGVAPAEHTARTRTKAAARQELDRLIATYAAQGEAGIDAAGMRFSALLDRFRADRLIDPVWLGEQKVAGYKHKDRLESRLRRLGQYWANWEIAAIDFEAAWAYKLHLIKSPTRRRDADGRPRPRSIYDVQHQLRALRLVLNFAKSKRWIQRTPFDSDKKLINPSHEQPRFRPEAPGELDRLLSECVGERAHLRPWIVCGVETALRPGEIDSLERRDLLFEEGVIVARATNTKTNKRREVPMTAVLKAALLCWFEFVDSDPGWSELIPDEPSARVFGPAKSNRRAFKTACRRAGIENLQRKDLRKWGTRRLIEALKLAGIPEMHGMAITGHSRMSTYQWYLDTDRRTVQDIGQALDNASKNRD